MRDPILTVVKKFLADRLVAGKPLLIGFSGGPDSLALLHLLMSCKVKLCVAHVDHGWRPESGSEAQELRRYVEALGLPFYLRRLEGVAAKEDAARRARLVFFQELYHQLGCQALVLGHQGDDQSETVLKRIFEGASWGALGGIRAVSKMEGMRIWRPLLGLKKSVLQAWVDKQGLKPLDDTTNRDPRYLRGRMRETILPRLEEQFGKEVSGNLRRLGDSAQELHDYLERQIQKYDRLVEEDGSYIRIDFSSCFPFEPLELKVFLKKITEKNKIFLSHGSLQIVYNLLEKGASCKKIGSKDRWVEICKRSIAIKKG